VLRPPLEIDNKARNTMQTLPGTAVVLGSSSGIGAALAKQLGAAGWRLGLAARRIDRLEALARELPSAPLVRRIDLRETEAAAALLEALFGALGGVDLVIISSGMGELNPDLDWALDRDTLAVNVLGFTAAAQVAMRHFLRRGRGHLVGITSVGGLRGDAVGSAYCASKAYQSIYLDGLRDAVAQRRLPIAVTEAQPGFVDTAMMKAPRPFWVASAEAAASQIIAAVRRRSKHVYVTRRWAIIALIFRLFLDGCRGRVDSAARAACITIATRFASSLPVSPACSSGSNPAGELFRRDSRSSWDCGRDNTCLLAPRDRSKTEGDCRQRLQPRHRQ
jgi:short-subunit dehydrogenase